MARTVVGLFQNNEAAQHVKTHLISEGYSAENIRIVASGAQALSGSPSSTGEKTDDTSFVDTISNFFRCFTGSDPEDEKHYTAGVSGGEALLTVTVVDNQADAVAELLERHGATNVDEQTLSQGTTQTEVPVQTAASTDASGTQKLDVVEEELLVWKRTVQRGGVRVYSHVTETPVEENVTLREEHVHIERHPVNRAATSTDFTAFQEGTIELTETAEEAVVSKTARVVEEVVVGKDVSERQQTIKDTVRHTDVKIEKVGVDPSETKS